MLRVDVLKSIVSLHPWESTYSRASRYFLSEKMRRVWTFATMYLGMSPYAAPSTYSLLQYIETVDGICPVESILLSDTGSATGVRLASGTELHADTVVINADLVYAYNELLPPSPQSRKLKQRPASCSSISFFWGFSESLPYLQTHNVFLADEYRESFDAIFAHHQIPNDPSFYVNVPSRIDSSAAPCDKETVVVLVPVGHLTPTQTEEEWNDLVTRTRDKVLNIIESRTGLHSLRSKIVHEIVHTPVTWEKRFNLDRGAILGLSHSFFNVLCFRPQMKHPRIGGLYFVGASTHPGTGVPVCLAGSKLVTRLIVQDWNSTGSRMFLYLHLTIG
ncbi:hypothetical protein BDV25DRAFT_130257 [Aspergillus avenaceus]|uniref:Phytoene desaturase n=1 Tax=Aspergillus avenaceus TaxID=36643 RepID=A0A5N6TTC5_ASPAV|nr:hypothetical protein BDV25DRAFT_130257 [Aspergillus avenaceus]